VLAATFVALASAAATSAVANPPLALILVGAAIGAALAAAAYVAAVVQLVRERSAGAAF